MALSYKNDHDADERLNPYDPAALESQEQAKYDDALEGIEDNFHNDADSSTEDANIASAAGINDMESMPRGGWQTNVDPKLGGLNPGNYANKAINKPLKLAKKGGPMAIIVGLLLGAAGLISFVGGPGLLLVHWVETLTGGFDHNATTLNHRYHAGIQSKIKNTTTGICTNKKSIGCKYAHMTDRQVTRFNSVSPDLKIIIDEDAPKIAGLRRAKAIEYKGKTISASQYRAELRSNPDFRNDMFKSYNWKFLSKSYTPFARLTKMRNLSKAAPFDPNDTDKQRSEKMLKRASGTDHTTTKSRLQYPDPCNETCKRDIDQKNDQRDRDNRVNEEAKKKLEKNQKAAQPNMFKRVTGKAGALGGLQEPCILPMAGQAISIGAKLNRADQLMRFGMMYLVIHSMIKAGEADPATVSYMANILTTTYKEDDGTITKAATDSFAYRNAAFGDTGVSDSASLMTVGGHIGGTMAAVGAFAMKPSVRKTCNVVTHPITIGASIVLSVIPLARAAGTGVSATINLALREVAKMAGKAFTIAMAVEYFVNVMIDVTTGVAVDEFTVGEAAGDAAGSGINQILSDSAGFGGNLALTPDQAVAFENNANQPYLAQQSDYERSETSPLDISNRHTMLGAVYSNMLPHLVNSSQSVPNAIASIQRITATIPSILSPQTAKAVTTEQYEECLDFDYRSMGIATTPMCHVVRGIPHEYLDIDPQTVNQYLLERNHIDPETGAPTSGEYLNTVDKCFSGKPLEAADKKTCVADPDNRTQIYFALHFVDEAIRDVETNGLPELDSINPVRSAPGGPTQPVGRFDDTSLSCPEDSTDDLGIVTTRYQGHLTELPNPKIRLCRIKDIPGYGALPGGGKPARGGAVVNVAVAPAFAELARLAKESSEEINLYSNSSFRWEHSCEIATPGAQCAAPGLSPHQLGVGIDFALSDGRALSTPLPSCVGRITSNDPVWKFLNTNGPALTIKQLTHENWHWEAGAEGNHFCPS